MAERSTQIYSLIVVEVRNVNGSARLLFLLEAQGGNPFPAFTGSWRLPAFLSSGPLTLQPSSYKDPGEYIRPTWTTEYFQTLDSITSTKSVLQGPRSRTGMCLESHYSAFSGAFSGSCTFLHLGWTSVLWLQALWSSVTQAEFHHPLVILYLLKTRESIWLFLDVFYIFSFPPSLVLCSEAGKNKPNLFKGDSNWQLVNTSSHSTRIH